MTPVAACECPVGAARMPPYYASEPDDIGFDVPLSKPSSLGVLRCLENVGRMFDRTAVMVGSRGRRLWSPVAGGR